MKTVAVMAQKGGAGKTTLALNLAVAASSAGKRSGVVDLDPLGSSLKWWRARKKLCNTSSPGVMPSLAIALPEVLEQAEGLRTDILFIDTAPHSDSDSVQAAYAADLILIPFKPSMADFYNIGGTFDIAAKMNKKVFGVMNMAPVSGNLGKEAVDYLKRLEYPVCPFSLAQRNDFMRAYAGGMSVLEFAPKGKAAQEVEQLYKWVLEVLSKKK